MTRSPGILVFSDLDGTLLDHADYSWKAAEPALARLKEIGAGLILATSKTAAEVVPIRRDIGFSDWPAIVENGGGLLAPGQGAEQGDAAYAEIRGILQRLPSGFTGFGDLSVRQVAEITGLSEAAARCAKTRRFSEPGVWTGSEEDLEGFLTAASGFGLAARRGGRFLTLSFGGTKADRMDELIKRFQPRVTIALGDAPNDVEMLQRADFGVIVANRSAPSLPELPGEEAGRVRRTEHEGPEGWAEAISALLEELPNIEESVKHG